MGRRHARGGKEAGSGCKRADKAKDSPEAALYVKAGRGETPVKISWDKKVEISLQRYVKKLLMGKMPARMPEEEKGRYAEKNGLPDRMPGKKA